MKHRVKHTIIIFLILISANSAIQAQTTSIKKHLGWHSTQVENIKIINQYGNIEFIHTNSDSVMVDATITIDNLMEKEAKDKLKLIQIKSNLNNNTANIKTSINQNLKTSQPFQIDYIVRIPSKKNVIIENKFGNIYFDSVHVDLDASILYGDIETNLETVIDLLNIDAEFSTLHIHKAQTVSIHAETSKLYADTLGKIKGSTEFSQINIKQVSEIDFTLSYDAIHINNCGLAQLNSKTSSIHIANCTSNIYAELKNGSLQLDDFTDKTEEIEIVSKSGSIEINNGYKTPSNINIKHYLSEVNLSEPLQDGSTSEENGQTTTIRTKETALPSDTKIRIDSQYGTINIR